MGWGKGRKVESTAPSHLSLQTFANSYLILSHGHLSTHILMETLSCWCLTHSGPDTYSAPSKPRPGERSGPRCPRGAWKSPRSCLSARTLCSQSPSRSCCLPKGRDGTGTVPPHPPNSLCPLHLSSSSQTKYTRSGLSRRSPALFLVSLPNILSSMSLGAQAFEG